MRKQILIITSVALASFLMGTIFSTNFLASGAKPPSVWDALDVLQAKVNELNATAIEQQAEITELQNRADILNATKLGTPNYDSGWVPVVRGDYLNLDHNLGTTDLLVYFVGKYDADSTIHQWMYGGGYDDNQGAVWYGLTSNQIKIERFINDVREPEGQWNEVRVMLWKIPEP